MPTSAKRAHILLGLALLAGLDFLAYLPSFRAPFIFDDRFNILENADVIRVGLGQAPLLALARPSLQSRRTLADLSFALNLRLFGQEPFSFHVVNLAIHILNGWLLFALLLTLLKILKGRGLAAGALAGSLLWSLHPVQVQAVTYIVQRMASLAALFYLLALLFWLQARAQPRRAVQVGWFLAALLSAWLGFETKETVVTLPLAVLLLEGVVLGRERTWPERRAWLGKAALVLTGYGLLLLAAIPKLSWDIADNVAHLSAGWTARLLNQPAVVWHYLSLLAFPLPSRLSLDPEWVSASGFGFFRDALPVLSLAALMAAGLYSLRVRPLAAGSGFFFLLTLLPESIIPLDPVFYHRLYLPSTLLLGAIGAGLARPRRFRQARLALLALSLIGLGILTYARNTAFGDEVRIWRDTVKKSPHQARAWTNLAAADAAQSQTSRALQGYLAAVRLDPRNLSAHLNLAYLYLNAGRPAEAREQAQQALALQPNHPLAMLAVAAVEGRSGHDDAALTWYRRVWETKPADPGVLEKLGQGLLEINRPDLAQDVYDKLLSLFPNQNGNYLLLGNALFYQGRWQEAAEAYEEELARDPEASEALNNLGMARLRLGQFQPAREAFARAAALDPRRALFQENLCEAELRLDHLAAAERACRQALALDPVRELSRQLLEEILSQKKK